MKQPIPKREPTKKRRAWEEIKPLKKKRGETGKKDWHLLYVPHKSKVHERGCGEIR